MAIGALIVLNVIAPGMASLPPAPATAVAGTMPDPPAIDGLVRLLEARGIRAAYASYWLAYRLTYESGGRVRGIPVRAASQLGFVRIPNDLAFAARLPAHALAWIFDSGSADERAFRLLLQRRLVRASSRRWATLTVYSGLSHPLRAPVSRVSAPCESVIPAT